jgi:SAM-dependent MidA family methyltransferase
MLTHAPLPDLSADELAHSERVAAHLRATIAATGGWIPFSRFMQQALYAPGLGYYSAGTRKFGAAGDFVTAPGLTPVFARCLATQVAGVLSQLGGGCVLEAGAGDAAMAADLLASLAGRGAAPARYDILEVSADLRERQRATLAARVPDMLERVRWLDTPPDLPWDGVLVANEVLDALPVERFRVSRGGYDSLGVACSAETFVFEPRGADEHLTQALDDRLGDLALPEGYASEACLMLTPWVAELTRGLARGAILFIDYGLPRAQYYHASRSGGSLCGFFRHRRVDDVLARPGLQDITAWVDFTAVAEAGLAAGFEVAGFSTQAHFLLATGLEQEVERARAGLDSRAAARLAQAAGMLVLPGEMGERFKVMALARGLELPLAGFSFRDLTATL